MAGDAAGWFQDTIASLQAWWAKGLHPDQAPSRAGGGRPQRQPQRQSSGPIGPFSFVETPDPWPELVSATSQPNSSHRMLCAAYGDQFVFTSPNDHLLILGPPRANKTAGILIPMVLAAPGPVVSSSTRDDVLRACGTTRSRMGTVWHFTPDGAPTAPGATPLRWSPLTTDYVVAKRFALAMLTTSESARGEAGRNSSYFSDQASRLVAPTLVAAALAGESMKWVTKILISQDPDAFTPVSDILAKHSQVSPGAENAADALAGILNMPGSHGSAADIFATAARTFEVYNDPAVIAATEPPNFDPAAFVAGQRDATNPGRFTKMDQDLSGVGVPTIQERLPRGIYDTIFITADGEAAEAVAPVIVTLLSALHREAEKLTSADQDAGIYDRPPMTWALDEVANMAPWPRFPRVLSTSAGSNILVAAVFHSPAQAREKWGDEAKALGTLMRHKIIFPGLDDDQTVKDIQDTVGDHEVQRTSTQLNTGTGVSGGFITGTGTRNSSEGVTTSEEKVPILDKSVIRRGNPQDPTAVLAVSSTAYPDGYLWVRPMPYYSDPPWAELLVGSLIHRYEAGDEADPRNRLPAPILDRDGGRALLRWRDDSAAKNLVEWLHFYRNWQRELTGTTEAES